MESKIVENFFDYSMELPIHKRYMTNYLVRKCAGCKDLPCINSHSGQPQRRQPILYSTGVWNYRPTHCDKSSCPYKELCLYAHNKEEIDFHPLVYKTRICEGKCNKSEATCPYAHGDLRQRPSNPTNAFNVDTFKVFPCQITMHHNHKICEKYHSIQKDRRRDPKTIYYTTEKCQKEHCEDENCPFSHNEFEFYYHDDRYKTEPCPYLNCALSFTCPYLHPQDYKILEDARVQMEMMELKDKKEMLEDMCKREEEDNKEFLKYSCVKCRKASDEIFLCGHLVCAECAQYCYCVVCKKPSSSIVVQDV